MASFEQFEIPLKIKYIGATDDDGRLNLYGGPKSIFGFAKTIQLTTHLILNGDVINKSTAAKNADFFLLPSKKGSYVQEVLIIVQNYPAESLASTIAVNVLSNHITDAIKWLVGSAAGIITTPYKPVEQKLGTKLEPYFDDLQVVLDGPILEAHKTIENSGGSIVLMNSGDQELVTLNRDSLEFIKETKITRDYEVIQGHVTRYNVLTGNGRLHDDETNTVIPFRPEKNFEDNLDLSWSLTEVDNGRDGDLLFTVKRVLNARDHTKRLLLSVCERKN